MKQQDSNEKQDLPQTSLIRSELLARDITVSVRIWKPKQRTES